MKKSIIITILAALVLGLAPLMAFDQPVVQQLQAKDHIVITKVTLTCKPKAGTVFAQWVHTSGEIIAGDSPTLTITMDRHQHISAQVRSESAKP